VCLEDILKIRVVGKADVIERLRKLHNEGIYNLILRKILD